VRIGQADDLPGVAGIGEDFLVAGEAGIENDFAAPAGASTRRASVKDPPVLQRERRAASLRRGQWLLLAESFHFDWLA
jgi:hypothetical protein